MDGSPPGSSVHGILQVRIPEWVAFPFPGDLPNPGIEPRSPTLQADSLPAEPQGKPKNTGVDSLSLLQGSFPTQELNWGLLPLQADSLPSELSGKPIHREQTCSRQGEETGGWAVVSEFRVSGCYYMHNG